MHTDCNIICNTGENDESHSFIGALQVFSAKSQISHAASFFNFCPLHATLLNLSERILRKSIISGASIVAYLPAKFSEPGRKLRN